MGNPRLGIKHPRKSKPFDITSEQVTCASRGDPMCCVIAQGLMKTCGSLLLEVEVLKTVTTLRYSGGRQERYATPKFLREALIEFDATGQWNLPPGRYYLLPVPRNHTIEHRREEARIRRESDDDAMKKTYPPTKRNKPRVLNPRLINLVQLRKKLKEKT